MTENAYGNYLYQAKDTFHSFDCSDIQECKYCTQLQLSSKNCYDMYQFGINIDHCYETSQTGFNISNCLFSYALVDNCSDMMYCFNCFSSKNCFMCYGMKHNEFCILNKQYTESEYYELLGKCIDKLIEEGVWWEHLDPKYSHVPYNDSMAQLWYPLSPSKASSRGYEWADESKRNIDYSGAYYQPLPLGQYDESVVGHEIAKWNIDACLSWVLQCAESSRPFKIISKELLYYIENSIPLPTLHPDIRRYQRFTMRDPRQLFERSCDQCGSDTQTPYSSERNEQVYCEECYRSTVY